MITKRYPVFIFVYLDEENELDIWLDEDLRLKSLMEIMEELFLIITIFLDYK